MPGTDLIVQVRLQDAVLHERRATCFVALVIVVECAPLARDRRLVDDSDKWLGDLLADHVGVDARALAVEVRFHAVADRLVQQDTAGTGCENHGHFTGRRSARVEQDHRPVDGLLDHRCQALFRIPVELFAGCDVREAGLHLVTLLGGNGDRDARHRSMIGDEFAVERRDHDALILVGPVNGNLVDSLIHRARRRFDKFHHRQLLVDTDVRPGHRRLVEVAHTHGIEGLRRRNLACPLRWPRRCVPPPASREG